MGCCVFCDRSPAPSFALTVQYGDPHRTSSGLRHVLPLCVRCHKALVVTGLEGHKLKGTSERWYAGHVVGRFESKGASIPVVSRLARARNRGGGEVALLEARCR